MDEEAILAGLAPTLRRLVQTHLCSRSVMKIPLFADERSYATLGLQLAVHDRLRPILREAREPIMECLEKGAPPGPSVFFLRRGSVAALSALPGVTYFDLDAATLTGAGALLGEQCLMAKSESIATYRALTRCELFALEIDAWFHILCETVSEREDVDAMARMVYAGFARCHVVRALSLRAAVVAAGTIWPVDPSRPKDATRAIQQGAALRLQVRWMQRIARRMLRTLDDPDEDLAPLVPALYFALWGRRRRKRATIAPSAAQMSARASLARASAGGALKLAGAFARQASGARSPTSQPTSARSEGPSAGGGFALESSVSGRCEGAVRGGSFRAINQEEGERALGGGGSILERAGTSNGMTSGATLEQRIAQLEHMEERMVERMTLVVERSVERAVEHAVSKAVAQVGRRVGETMSASFTRGTVGAPLGAPPNVGNYSA
jgi:CRP-like cAMP-binding protein